MCMESVKVSAELSFVADVKAQDIVLFCFSPPKVEVKAFQSVLAAVPRQQKCVVEYSSLSPLYFCAFKVWGGCVYPDAVMIVTKYSFCLLIS